MEIILKIYDWMHSHRHLSLSILGVWIVAMVWIACGLNYRENITDFLPVTDDYQRSMDIYQEVSGGDKIVVLLSSDGDWTETKDRMSHIVSAASSYKDIVSEADTAGWLKDLGNNTNSDAFLDVLDVMYSHLPLLLTEDDYAQIDSAWNSSETYIAERLNITKNLIASPASAMISDWIPLDPLGMFDSVGKRMKSFQPDQMTYAIYDNNLFSPDSCTLLLNIRSPFGSSESGLNSRLISLLSDAKQKVESDSAYSDIKFSIIGAPVIAVNNSEQIRFDSILALAIAVILIMSILLWSLRSVRGIVLIGVTTSFGFLFALACFGIFAGDISIIVLGIAAAIIGIAVNYPLHYICHLQHQPNTRLALKDLVAPLLIGNITTVGAFMALVPLEAVAMRDLGIFSALMLVGTILFVFLFLPHISNGIYAVDVVNDQEESHSGNKHNWMYSPWFLLLIVAVTAVLGWKSLDTSFDSNLSHINYMTDEQRSGLEQLSSMRGESKGTTIYIASADSSYDGAISQIESLQPELARLCKEGKIHSVQNPAYLLPSIEQQQHNLALWRQFWNSHDVSSLPEIAVECGFSPSAFELFMQSISAEVSLLADEEFELLSSSILQSSVSKDKAVAQLVVDPKNVDEVESALRTVKHAADNKSPLVFDLTSLNSQITNNLSADFNYIGIACGFIVFIFLWISFRRIEIAIIAFLPMVIGWLWILGLMQLFNIQFNIVNIILATFIFGQGDDYTIFITEGLIRDYKTRGNALVSYQRSILLSAAIMLIGIGALIVARHPAMFSLAEVTIIGMLVVVVMAWFVPPIALHWILKYDKSLERFLLK